MPRLAATASCDVTEMRQSEHAISYGDAHVAEARSPRGPAGVQLALDCRAYQDWHNVIDWLSNPVSTAVGCLTLCALPVQMKQQKVSEELHLQQLILPQENKAK